MSKQISKQEKEFRKKETLDSWKHSEVVSIKNRESKSRNVFVNKKNKKANKKSLEGKNNFDMFRKRKQEFSYCIFLKLRSFRIFLSNANFFYFEMFFVSIEAPFLKNIVACTKKTFRGNFWKESEKKFRIHQKYWQLFPKLINQSAVQISFEKLFLGTQFH